MDQEIAKVRPQMEEDEQLVSLMRRFRGQNLSESHFDEMSAIVAKVILQRWFF